MGGGEAAFCGQGGSGETETMLTEKFVHAVGQAVGNELGTARSQPLFLASVAQYLPIYRDATPIPHSMAK
ncbi:MULTISPECIES: baeRF7 domain-containing protein [Arthrobacter]|uniref:baeRF7 domain-containing protein n=1 Tax=Arthrobacter TaxID=1663 RepID=UPI0037C07AF9